MASLGLWSEKDRDALGGSVSHSRAPGNVWKHHHAEEEGRLGSRSAPRIRLEQRLGDRIAPSGRARCGAARDGGACRVTRRARAACADGAHRAASRRRRAGQCGRRDRAGRSRAKADRANTARLASRKSGKARGSPISVGVDLDRRDLDLSLHDGRGRNRCPPLFFWVSYRFRHRFGFNTLLLHDLRLALRRPKMAAREAHRRCPRQ